MMKINVKPKPQVGDLRMIKRFLWFPLRVENQIRWLETAEIGQRYTFYRKWVNEAWGN